MRPHPDAPRRPGAIRRAALRGIQTVTVLACLLSPGAARAGGTSCKDEAITSIVRTRLRSDPIVGAFVIDVSTSACVVTLSGCVESRDQARRAKELAKRLVHVRVKNDLKVCTIAPRRSSKATRRS